MGLAQRIAYSSLLAFFPAMAFLVAALGLSICSPAARPPG